MVIHCNFQLATNQLTGECAIKNQRMDANIKQAQKLFKNFNSAYLERFSRTSNNHANVLATLTSVVEFYMKRIIEVELLLRPSIEAGYDCNMIFDIKPIWEFPGLTQLSITLEMEVYLMTAAKFTESGMKLADIGHPLLRRCIEDHFQVHT